MSSSLGPVARTEFTGVVLVGGNSVLNSMKAMCII